MNPNEDFLKVRQGVLNPIQNLFGTFPLDNLSDANTWIDKLEEAVGVAENRTMDLQAGVRDGEFGREGAGKLFRQLEWLYESLAFFDEVVDNGAHDIDQMIDKGWADYEDDDEIPDFLVDGLSDVLADLEDGFVTLEDETIDPDLEGSR